MDRNEKGAHECLVGELGGREHENKALGKTIWIEKKKKIQSKR